VHRENHRGHGEAWRLTTENTVVHGENHRGHGKGRRKTTEGTEKHGDKPRRTQWYTEENHRGLGETQINHGEHRGTRRKKQRDGKPGDHKKR